MDIVKILIFIAILGVGLFCLFKNKDWATRLHKYYIQESQKSWHGKLFHWEASWVLWLFRALIIFFGLIFLLAAYPVAFGTVYF